jgi:hypothetical protein
MYKGIAAAIIFVANAQTLATPSLAPKQNCTPLPLALAAWNAPDATIKTDMLILLEKPIIVPLQPTINIRFSKPPERTPDTESFSNSVKISLKHPGVYQLAAEKPVWLDVVAPEGIEPSLSHQHGPTCSSIRKIVEYKLAAGSHIIQISGSKTASIKIMMVRIR